MSATSGNYTNFLREGFFRPELQDLVFSKKQRPLINLFKHEKFVAGSTERLVLEIADGQDATYDITAAIAQSTALTSVKMNIDVKELNMVGKVPQEDILRTANNKQALAQVWKRELYHKANAMAESIEKAILGAETGAIGTISGTSTSVIYMNSDYQANKIQIGHQLVAAASTSSALRSATPGVVSAVDVVNRKITFSAAIAGTFNPSSGDTVFPYGMYDSASDTNAIKAIGDWIPASEPTSGDSFNGLDRSVDPIKLAGQRFTGTTSTIVSSVQSALVKMPARALTNADVVLMSYTTLAQLDSELRDQQRYTNSDSKAFIGFKGFEFRTAAGDMYAMGHRFMPDDTIFILDSSTWKIVYLPPEKPQAKKAGDEEMVHFVDFDGQWVQWNGTSKDHIFMLESYLELVCSNPGANARITLTS